MKIKLGHAIKSKAVSLGQAVVRPSRRMKTKRSPLEASGSLVHVLLLRELQGDWFVKELTVNLPAIMMKEKQEMLEGYCS